MTDLPEPLTPADCDLRDTPFDEMRAALVQVAMRECGLTQAEAEELFDSTFGRPS